MKETGIVRRIDELGRIVIPKEIRRVERMKEGSPVEIFLNNNGEVVLKKYSPVFDLKEYALDICKSIGETIEYSVLISDLDAIIVGTNISRNIYMNKVVSKEVENIMESRKCYMGNKSDNSSMIPLFEGDEEEYSAQIVSPILSQGDLCGSIIMFKKDGSFSLSDINLVKIFSNFLARQMN